MGKERLTVELSKAEQDALAAICEAIAHAARCNANDQHIVVDKLSEVCLAQYELHPKPQFWDSLYDRLHRSTTHKKGE